MSLVIETARFLADVPNPAPADPTGGAKGVGLLVSYVKWGVLLVCALAALGSAGFMAAGHLSNRPETAERGKRAFLWAVGSVIAAALAIPLVNSVFGAAS
ncbi:MAG TPA: hypothetical protein VK453_13570 [Micromonosporaceae bacterium]|nr:hypothetical protein [Micromonosporaceae bacterium]